jgi:hypothetical protein
VEGTLVNHTSFMYQSGLFNGRLVNQGSVSLGTNFVAGNGLESDGPMTIVAGQTLITNGGLGQPQPVYRGARRDTYWCERDESK